MPIQYARVKNAANGEEVSQESTDPTYGFVDEFLEEAVKSSIIYQADQDSFKFVKSRRGISLRILREIFEFQEIQRLQDAKHHVETR